MTTASTEGIKPLHDHPGAPFVILAVAMVLTPLLVSGLTFLAGDGPMSAAAALIALLFQQLVMLTATFYRLGRLGEHWTKLNLFVENIRDVLRGLWWGVGLLFVNVFGSQISALLLAFVFGPQWVVETVEREQASVMRLLDPEAGVFELAFTVFLAVGVAPFVEEVFFRGYAYRVLKSHVGKHALWISALLFAGVHFYVINFIPVFLLGLVFAHLYERTGTLSAPIIAHATVNGLVAVINVAAGRLLN